MFQMYFTWLKNQLLNYICEFFRKLKTINFLLLENLPHQLNFIKSRWLVAFLIFKLFIDRSLESDAKLLTELEGLFWYIFSILKTSQYIFHLFGWGGVMQSWLSSRYRSERDSSAKLQCFSKLRIPHLVDCCFQCPLRYFIMPAIPTWNDGSYPSNQVKRPW